MLRVSAQFGRIAIRFDRRFREPNRICDVGQSAVGVTGWAYPHSSVSDLRVFKNAFQI